LEKNIIYMIPRPLQKLGGDFKDPLVSTIEMKEGFIGMVYRVS